MVITIIVGIVALLLGLVGGFFLGAWALRRSMANAELGDQEIIDMAKKMGRNLNPRQVQMIRQQMKKAGNNPPPLLGKRSSDKSKGKVSSMKKK
ncbi:YneF family protein [Ferroacidibacillus organovorans]|uniref:YneF family protein n=1 Tax=Ferroacidibacillus organovorans TaxID=1765683 RepID=UPI0013656487|nr:YneF family protein [Ferroacidibacillus organovorans]